MKPAPPVTSAFMRRRILDGLVSVDAPRFAAFGPDYRRRPVHDGRLRGDDDSGTSGTKSSEAAADPVPAELLGTYETTLKKSDLPANPPGELTAGPTWKLTIAKSGGVNDGPVFAIANGAGQGTSRARHSA